jgi:gluconate 5-dehydrogenase
MALEWAPSGITVNAIGPGSIQTEMAATLLPTPEALEAFVRTQIPIGRAGETSDVVGAAIFFASDAARYVTGQVLYVDGGWSIV